MKSRRQFLLQCLGGIALAPGLAHAASSAFYMVDFTPPRLDFPAAYRITLRLLLGNSRTLINQSFTGPTQVNAIKNFQDYTDSKLTLILMARAGDAPLLTTQVEVALKDTKDLALNDPAKSTRVGGLRLVTDYRDSRIGNQNHRTLFLTLTQL